MVLVIHGEAGGWDELLIAVLALAVLWVAIKLAGRKAADENDENDKDDKDDAHDSGQPLSEGASGAEAEVVERRAAAEPPTVKLG